QQRRQRPRVLDPLKQALGERGPPGVAGLERLEGLLDAAGEAQAILAEEVEDLVGVAVLLTDDAVEQMLGHDLVELTLRRATDCGFEHARGHGAEALDEDFGLDAHARAPEGSGEGERGRRVCPTAAARLNRKLAAT